MEERSREAQGFVTFYRFYGGYLPSGKSLPYTFAALLRAIYPFYLCSDGERYEALWYLLTSTEHICCEISQGTGWKGSEKS